MNNPDKTEALLRLIGDVCDTLQEGDGVDPRDQHREKKKRRERRGAMRSSPHFRKRAQLRTQVTEALVYWLREQDDEQIADLTLVDVEPFPDTDHFRATLMTRPPMEGEVIDLVGLERRLGQCASDARRWVGYEIHRKRVPLISFAVVPAREDVGQ
ncbi:MAG: hypothetical protein VYE40_07105 [Myxococcota bacterium]|nr:hypothetical protein [Myxococcota bacterium]